LEAIVAEQRGQSFTYREVGATAGELPPGYHRHRYSGGLGEGEAAFQRGVSALRGWQAHRGAGIDVVPSTAPLEPGVDVVLCFRVGAMNMLAACRVAYVVDEPGRFGFAYGTLPMHPEEGEEAFVIEQKANGVVSFEITAFSRPRSALSRLGGPVGRQVQRRVTLRYLEAVRRFVQGVTT
jgi:uncharacterized protein (UPF0548 family)